MKLALVLCMVAPLLAAETFTVIHKKTAWSDGHGTVEITDDGISFQAKKEKRSRRWGWLDIQHFDRISETEFVVLSYEDRKRYLGRDRSWRFLITDGKLTDSLFREISGKLTRPPTNRVVRDQPALRYSVPVKHLHTFGGCEGELRFTDEAIYYVTDHTRDAREWLLARDVDSIWSSSKYNLEVHAHDSRLHRFDLKEPLDAEYYRKLKLRLFAP